MDNYKGLKWFKCDLHLHTPISECFIDKCAPIEYIEYVKEKGLNVIGITDHNSPGWIDELKPIARENNITLFPGVEITVGGEHCHYLIVFDIDKTDKDIERFLMTKLGISDKDFAKDIVIDKQIQDVQRMVEEDGLIIIPAHIDSYSGLNQVVDEKIRGKILSHETLNAVEIVLEKSNDNKNLTEKSYDEIREKNDRRNFKKISNAINQVNQNKLCKLTFSDNPHIEDPTKHGLDGIGKMYSWIKMKEEPNLESLRQALILGKDRIKNNFESPKKPYFLPNIWIEKIILDRLQ